VEYGGAGGVVCPEPRGRVSAGKTLQGDDTVDDGPTWKTAVLALLLVALGVAMLLYGTQQ